MKILIYGFRSYDRQNKNISQEILLNIPDKKNIVKVVFPLRYDKEIIIKEIRKHRPDIIIGISQCDEGHLFRIERKAFNFKKIGTRKVEILKNHPNYYFLNLFLKDDSESWHSYNNQEPFGNFSMYLISHFYKNTHFAFINVPKNYDILKAAYYIEKKIEDSTNEFHLLSGEQTGLTNFNNRKKEENYKLNQF